MTTDGQRLARAAFDAARATFERLTSTADPAELATALREAWRATEGALRSLAGTTTLSGTALVRELRQRSLLSLDDAHALVDFQAAAERAGTDDYTPSAVDIAAATSARDRLDLAFTRDHTVPGPTGPLLSGPISAAAPRASASPLPPPEASPPSGRRNSLAVMLMVVVLVAVVVAGGYYAFNISREPADLRRGRAAFAAGDRLTARNAFAAAASSNPALAEPHVYLGRLARDEGDMATASAELRRAVEVEPENPLAHRELAAYLLASGQFELARSFYQRAIELQPTDRVALGWMACTLHRLGRFDLAPRFAQRAGVGPWQECLALSAAPLVPAPTASPDRLR